MEIIDRHNQVPRSTPDSRSISATPVEPDKLKCLLNAAGETPAHGDDRPWSFILETSGGNHVSDYLSEADKPWAKRAPVLMIVVVRVASNSTNEPNVYAFRDTRHPVSNLLLAPP